MLEMGFAGIVDIAFPARKEYPFPMSFVLKVIASIMAWKLGPEPNMPRSPPMPRLVPNASNAWIGAPMASPFPRV